MGGEFAEQALFLGVQIAGKNDLDDHQEVAARAFIVIGWIAFPAQTQLSPVRRLGFYFNIHRPIEGIDGNFAAKESYE